MPHIEPTPEEMDDVVKNVIPRIGTAAKMRSHLGEPTTHQQSHPNNPSWVNQFTYEDQWRSLDLIIQESSDGALEFMVSGKWIQNPQE